VNLLGQFGWPQLGPALELLDDPITGAATTEIFLCVSVDSHFGQGVLASDELTSSSNSCEHFAHLYS
jgi:hypothetical protein